MDTKFKGIKNASEYRRGELTKNILRLIGAGMLIGSATVVAPNTLQIISYFDPKGREERNRIWKAIKYLESRDRIMIVRQGEREYIHLTPRGRIRLSEDSIWELAIRAPRRWDRKWRLVMFDLPSRHERIRHSFRLKLEDLGFKMYQRSVFIHPHECEEVVFAVAKWYGIDEHVRYIVATEIHDLRRFAKEFDLL